MLEPRCCFCSLLINHFDRSKPLPCYLLQTFPYRFCSSAHKSNGHTRRQLIYVSDVQDSVFLPKASSLSRKSLSLVGDTLQHMFLHIHPRPAPVIQFLKTYALYERSKQVTGIMLAVGIVVVGLSIVRSLCYFFVFFVLF